MHTVGILGINGNVGKPTTELLIKAAEQDKIKLVVLHREGRAGDVRPGKNVELRVIDLEGPQDRIEEAVKGINVFVSMVGIGGLGSELPILEVLTKSPDFVTFMPATYSTTWNEQDFADPVLAQVFSTVVNSQFKAMEMGLGVTKIYTGIFDFTTFQDGFMFCPIKENSIALNEKILKSKLAITTMPHLAHAITQIVTTNSPTSIKNKEFSAVTFWPTGAELRDLYTKLHDGKEPKVMDWTPAEREKQRADLTTYGPVRVGYMDKWEDESWEYESNGRVLVGGYEGPGLEEVARSYL